jgi:hypothetical protein
MDDIVDIESSITLQAQTLQAQTVAKKVAPYALPNSAPHYDQYFKPAMNTKETAMFWEVLQEFAKLMDQRGVNWTLAYGTMVGAHCLGNMLPWDDELDVFVIGRKSWDILNEIFWELQTPRTDYKYRMTADDRRQFGLNRNIKFFHNDGRANSAHRGNSSLWKSPFIDIARMDCGENDADTFYHATRNDRHMYSRKHLFPIKYTQFGDFMAPMPACASCIVKDRYNLEACTKCKYNNWNHMDERYIRKCSRLDMIAEAPDCYVSEEFTHPIDCRKVISCPDNVMDGHACCVQRTVAKLPEITQAKRDSFLRQVGLVDAKKLNTEICVQLKSIEMYSNPKSFPSERGDSTFKVMFWNAERGTHWEKSLEYFREADIILLNEMDIGMARSGNVNIAYLLAKALNMNYVQGIEFVELTNGIESEIKATKGMNNTQGFHNNAILSRYPLFSPQIQRMPTTNRWFGNGFGYGAHSEVRLGGRMALYVKTIIDTKPLWLVVTHIDGTSNEFEALAKKISGQHTYHDGAMILVGDLHRKRIPVLERVASLDFSINEKNRRIPTWGYRHNGIGVESHGHDHTHLFGIRGFATASDVEILPPEGPHGELLSDSGFLYFHGKLL